MGLGHALEGPPSPLFPVPVLVVTLRDRSPKKCVVPFCIYPNGLFISGSVLDEDVRPN